MPQRGLRVVRRADLPLPVHDHGYCTDTFHPHWDYIHGPGSPCNGSTTQTPNSYGPDLPYHQSHSFASRNVRSVLAHCFRRSQVIQCTLYNHTIKRNTSLIRSGRAAHAVLYMDPKPKTREVSSVIRSQFVALIAFDYSESHLQVASKAITYWQALSRSPFEFGLFVFRSALGFSRVPPQASLHYC